MADPDRSDPEIIDFSPHPARTRRPIAIAIAAAVAIAVAAAVVVVFVVIRPGVFNSALIPAVTDQTFPPLDTWTFYGSGYTSKYLTFVPVETRSNVLVSRHANPLEKNSYTVLQRLTPAQQVIFAKYDNLRAVPFADFGNRYALTGSSFDPDVLEHETWSQIAAELRNPHGITGRSILGTVNYITAAICQLTHDQPATACTPAVRSLLPGG